MGPTKLGKYELIRQIAVGGMAELYLARTQGIEGFEKLVVLKRIHPQLTTNKKLVDMFLREAKLAATLHHPNIAQVYDIGGGDNDYFFTLEYVHGEDLGRLLAAASENGVPLSLDVALTFAVGVCAGLHYAHEKLATDGRPLEVVHRDVSPSNVLISYDGAVKIVDFGIARVSSTHAGERTHGGIKGKIGYMSPEQCRGGAKIDRRSDLFSVGVLLYELTTGRAPFRGDGEFQTLEMIVNSDAAPPSTLVPSYSPGLERIVMKALARDVEQRYATALALQQDLEDFAHENRLRTSALVVARLMSSLFPARLEEWQQAQAQGQFFLEQHVVQTLEEAGKTGVSGQRYIEPAPDTGQDTRIEPPIAVDDHPTEVKLRTPVPAFDPTTFPVPRGGTLVSSPIGDQTRTVIIAANQDATMMVPSRKRKRRMEMILGGIAGVIAILVIYLATRPSDADAERPHAASPSPSLRPTPSPSPTPTPSPTPSPKIEPEPEPEPEPVRPAPAVKPEPVPAPRPAAVAPKPAPVAPKKPAAVPSKPPVAKPAPTKKKPDQWDADSPFMPVR